MFLYFLLLIVLQVMILLPREKGTAFQNVNFDIKIHAFTKTCFFFWPLLIGIFVFRLTTNSIYLCRLYLCEVNKS